MNSKATIGFLIFLLVVSLIVNGFFVYDKSKNDGGTTNGGSSTGTGGSGTGGGTGGSSGGGNLEEVALQLDLNNLLVNELYDFVTYETEKNLVENSIYTNGVVTINNLSERDKLARIYDKTGEYFSMSCETFHLINYKFTTNSVSNMAIANSFICYPNEDGEYDGFLNYKGTYARYGYPVAYRATFAELSTQVSKWFGKTASVNVIDFSPNYSVSCVVDMQRIYCLDVKSNLSSRAKHEFVKALKYTDRIEIYNKYAYYDEAGVVYNNVLRGEKLGTGYNYIEDNIFERYTNIKTYKHTFKMNNDGSYYWYSTEPA